jgi:hypothetical protein
MVMIKSNHDIRSKSTDFNPAEFQTYIPNTLFITEVTKVVPLYFRVENRFDEIEDQKIPDTIVVAMNGNVGGNLLTTKNGVGGLYEVVLITGVDRDKTYTQYENNGDMYLWDIDYGPPRDLSRIQISLLNSEMETLVLPSDSTVTLVLKVFHATHHR